MEQASHKSLNLGKLFLGLLLVFAGMVYFARAAGFLPAYGGMHWTQLWPVIFIFLGFSLIKVRSTSGAIAGIALTIAVLGVTAYAMFSGEYRPRRHMMFGLDGDIKKELPWFADRPCGTDGVPNDSDWLGVPEGWRMHFYDQ